MASNIISQTSKQAASGFRRLFLGQCHPCQISNASRIVVKKLEFDANLNMLFLQIAGVEVNGLKVTSKKDRAKETIFLASLSNTLAQICNTSYFTKMIPHVAYDPEKVCKIGDVVLIEELPKRMTRDIMHKVVKVVYPMGDVVDPISGKPCVGGQLREDMERIDQLWGKNENAFDYDKAPSRGWQEGRKDWSHKRGYRRFNEFSDRDQTESSL